MSKHTLVSKVARKEPIVRFPIPVRQSVAVDLERYKEFYEAVYQEPVEIKALMASMLETVLEKDKAFQKYKKEHPVNSPQPSQEPATPTIDLSLLPGTENPPTSN